MVQILKYGNTNTYLIKGESANLLVDTDWAGTLQSFYLEIKKHNIKISDITHIIATHYHPDHIGLVGELIKMGIKLIIVDSQVSYIHFADKIFAKDKSLKYQPIDEKDAIIIKAAESRNFLKGLGINGEIIKTPSHSEDSISLILGCGDCIVGDLEPFDYISGYGCNVKLLEDWNAIMRFNPKTIHFGHFPHKTIEH